MLEVKEGGGWTAEKNLVCLAFQPLAKKKEKKGKKKKKKKKKLIHRPSFESALSSQFIEVHKVSCFQILGKAICRNHDFLDNLSKI